MTKEETTRQINQKVFTYKSKNMRYYKILRNGQEIKSALQKNEAIKELAIAVDNCAMETNYYLTDESHTVTNPDNGRVIFKHGDESATIGDSSFEIVEEK